MESGGRREDDCVTIGMSKAVTRRGLEQVVKVIKLSLYIIISSYMVSLIKVTMNK